MRIDTKDRHWEVMCLYTQDNKMETCYRVGVGLDCGVTQAWIRTLTLPLISSVIRNKLVQVKTLVSWQDLIILNISHSCSYLEVSQGALGVKNPPANAGDTRDMGSIPGLGRYPREGHGNPLQYSCLRISWTEEPGGLQSTGSPRVGHHWSNLAQCSRR